MRFGVVLLAWAAIVGCGDDDAGSEAERRGIGAECASDEDCTEEGQHCLPFKGGYCGLSDCTANDECPAGSACVAHSDGSMYCFLVCTDKPQCNDHRSSEFESNCSANIAFTDPETSGVKACVPPS